MPEYRSALYDALITGKHGAALPGASRVTLAEDPPGVLWQLAGWDGFDTAVPRFLEAIGAKLPQDFGTVAEGPGLRIYRTAPNRVLIHSENLLEVPDYDPQSLAFLDLSHSRTVVQISGPDAAAVLSRSAPMDFENGAFAQGHFVQTGIHEVAVLIDRAGADRFRILIPYTWAENTWERLCMAAAPFGYEILS